MHKPRFSLVQRAAVFIVSGVLAGCSGSDNVASPVPNPVVKAPTNAQLAAFDQKINHIIVIYQENWSFDALMGFYPGVNGYQNAMNIVQTDLSGNPITALPQPKLGNQPDPNFAAAAGMSAAPFNLGSYIQQSTLTGDPNHNFYVQQAEIDGGKMDHYLAYANVPADGTQGGLPLGYWDTRSFPEGQIAQQYSVLDNFHQSTFGGSYINNLYAFCACVAQVPNGPASLVEPVDASGNPTAIGAPEGRMTPDFYVVNTSYTVQYPQLASGASVFVPPLDNPTIGDRLTNAGVSWAFYSGGLNDALAGKADSTFQAHHQSPLYFRNYGPGTPGFANHIKDFDATFMNDLSSGNLPHVSIVKLLGKYNEHPGYATIVAGQMEVANLISAIQMSSAWKDSMILVYYDEAGGHFDHVPPVPVDRWGPSTRVPAYVVSPFAKRSNVDHTNYEVASILATIEQRYGLQPLAARDAAAAPLLNMFDFTLPTPSAYARQSFKAMPPVPTLAIHKINGQPVTEVNDDQLLPAGPPIRPIDE